MNKGQTYKHVHRGALKKLFKNVREGAYIKKIVLFIQKLKYKKKLSIKGSPPGSKSSSPVPSSVSSSLFSLLKSKYILIVIVIVIKDVKIHKET